MLVTSLVRLCKLKVGLKHQLIYEEFGFLLLKKQQLLKVCLLYNLKLQQLYNMLKMLNFYVDINDKISLIMTNF